MSGPEITEFTDEIRYLWRDRHVALCFTRLHETDSGRVVGFMSVINPDRRNGNGPERLYWQSVTLTTVSDRKVVTAKLEGLVKTGTWEQDIDRTFMDVYERHTAVPEPVPLAPADDAEIDTEYLIDPVLPVGQVTLLLADQGSTKSYLMLYLSACIALGCRTVFSEPLHTGPVIYFDWEVDEQVASRRLAWICRGLSAVEAPRGLYYVNMSTRGRIFDRIRDMRHMIERIQPVLVVIDSLTFATGADLNSAEYAAPTMTAVGSLGEGITKLISAHPNKASRNANTEDISVIGSTLFEYRARAIWHMKREQSRAARFGVSMTPRKQFDGPPQKPLAYSMEFDNVAHTARFQSAKLSDMPSLEKGTMTAQDKIRRALARGGRLDTKQLAEVTGVPEANVRVECGQMPDVFPIVLGGGRGKPTVWALKADP